MPKFIVAQKTNLPPSESFQRIKKYLEDGEDLKKLDSNIKCQFDEEKLSGKAKGSKFECDLSVIGTADCTVQLDVSIPFVLTPFKGKIQEVLERKLKKLFA